MKRGLCMVILMLATLPVRGHELQSVSLRLEEMANGLVQVMLKTPLARDGNAVAVVPQFEPACNPRGEIRVVRQTGLILRQWRMQCNAGLTGHVLRFQGLDPRMPDALLVARFADGRQLTATVDRHDPVILLQPVAQTGVPPGLLAYLPIGVEHILLGPDHLLFVLGLMLVVYQAGKGLRMLVLALTAFTVAHSLTLVMAVLGIWGLPARAVELLIALSIVLLAMELAGDVSRRRRGQLPSLTMRKPWLVAFIFGLLHGFGFAGALAAVGLPEQARGWALFLFNVGVEVGQLIFVMTVLLAVATLRWFRGITLTANVTPMTVTALGGIAMYWTLDRLLVWSALLWAGA